MKITGGGNFAFYTLHNSSRYKEKARVNTDKPVNTRAFNQKEKYFRLADLRAYLDYYLSPKPDRDKNSDSAPIGK